MSVIRLRFVLHMALVNVGSAGKALALEARAGRSLGGSPESGVSQVRLVNGDEFARWPAPACRSSSRDAFLSSY
jgi:hypothetical protein